MLDIVRKRNKKELKLIITGRIDTTTAPQFAEAVGDLKKTEKLVFDFAKVEYISSAGLKVVLSAYKKLPNAKENMMLVHVNKDVYSVFRITGLADKIDIQQS